MNAISNFSQVVVVPKNCIIMDSQFFGSYSPWDGEWLPTTSVNKQVVEMEQKIKDIIEMINTVLEDTSVPKNIRKALSDAKMRLQGKEEAIVRVSAAIYLVEPISEDVNMPAHARTQVWAIISALEAIKH